MYLGHVVGNGTVKPEHGKLEAVQDFSTPETKSQVHAFLGLTVLSAQITRVLQLH